MRKARKIYILLAVLLVLCVATFAISQYNVKQEEISISEETILAIDYDTVTAVSWTYIDEDDEDAEETTLSFTRTDDVWTWDEDEAFPVSEDTMYAMLEQFEEFTVAFEISDVDDYSTYGLDDPVCTIHIEADGDEYDISLGDYSTMDEQRYVSIGDDNAYLVSHDPVEEFDATIEEMIDNSELLDTDTAISITFEGTESCTINYEEESTATYCADDVYFATVDGEYLPLDTELVGTYLETMAGIDLSTYVSYNVTDDELVEYGLDDPLLTITVVYAGEDDEGNETEETYVLHISRNADDIAAEEAAAAAEEEEEDASEDEEEETEDTDETEDEDEEEEEVEFAAYLRVGDSQIVYSLSETTYEALMDAGYNGLRHKEAVTCDFDEVTQIDVEIEGEDYTLTTETDPDDEESLIWTYNEEEISLTSFETLLYVIEAEEFVDSTDGAGDLEISLILTLDNENFSEVTVEFYRYDGTYCLAVVDGDAFGLCLRSDVVDMIESMNAIVLN